MVAPVRSRATMIGICPADRPRLAALPPRLRDALGRSRRLPLKDSRDEGLVRLDDPGQARRLVEIERGQEPMSPPERGGVGRLAAFRGLRDRLAGDQRLRLVRPAILVMQAGQRRPGQRVECLPAARAAVPRLAARLAPGTNVIPTAARTAKARNPAPPDLRQQVFLRRGIVRLRDRERGRNSSLRRQHGGIDRVSRRVNRIVRFGQRQFPERLGALRRVQKPNPAKPSRKRRAEIESRRRRYLGDRPPIDVKDRVTIVIDDGIATGATIRAALRATRLRAPKTLVLAVPVASSEALAEVGIEADDVICPEEHEFLGAIGSYYSDFRQTSDQEVIEAMARYSSDAKAGKTTPGPRTGGRVRRH